MEIIHTFLNTQNTEIIHAILCRYNKHFLNISILKKLSLIIIIVTKIRKNDFTIENPHDLEY